MSADTPPPEAMVFSAAARARLAGLHRELVKLYPDVVADGGAPFFRLQAVPEPALAIGRYGAVHVDGARGVPVLRIAGCMFGTVTIETADDEALLDHIVCHLERPRAFSPTAQGPLSALVGRSLEEVERGLVLATLCRFQFDHVRAAEVLGISLRTIRNTLTRHRARNGADGEGDGPRVRESLPEGRRHGDRGLSGILSINSPHRAGEGDQRQVQNQKEEGT